MANRKVLTKRKDALFADLTTLCEFFHDIRNREACILRAKYERFKILESELDALSLDILEYNTNTTEAKEEISLKDRDKFLDLVDAIRSAYLKFEKDVEGSTTPNAGKPSLHKVQLPSYDGSVERCMGFNYQLAYDAFVNRYHSPRRLLSYYLQLILKYRAESSLNPQKFLNVHEAAISALKNLNVTDLADFILFQLSFNNLDQLTRQALDLSLRDINGVPQTSDLLEFITIITKSDELKRGTCNKVYDHFAKIVRKTGQTQNSAKVRCSYCGSKHFLDYCKTFKEKPLSQRIDFINKKRLCTNCLGNHPLKECWSSKLCRICKGKHHSWLHIETSPTSHLSPEQSEQSSVSSNHFSQRSSSLLLATATILIRTGSGYNRIRALIGPGSKATFISEAVVQRFRLPRRTSTTYVSGVGDNNITKTRDHILLEFKSIYNSASHTTSALILNQLSGYVPPKLQLKDHKLVNLNWADDLESTDPIEIILGAEIYPELILEGVWKSPNGALLAQSTTLGWILSGSLDNNIENPKEPIDCSTDKKLSKSVK